MTRKEAMLKVREAGDFEPASIVRLLEALGLLKFEDYDPVPVPVIEVDRESLTNIQKAFGLPHRDYVFLKYAHFKLKAEKKQTDEEWTAELVVRNALINESKKTFSTFWNNEDALRLAKAAIDAYKNYMYEGA